MAPGIAGSTYGQDSLREQPAAATVALSEWSIKDPSAIRKGQVSLIKEPDNHRLSVYYLATENTAPSETSNRSYQPPKRNGTLKISDFDHENRNELGGYFNVFFRAPSEASATIDEDSSGQRSLRFSGDKADLGFCGMWIHLFDFGLPRQRREYLDVRDFEQLEFLVRQDSTTSGFVVKMSDAEWEEREDALVVGDLSEFIGGEPDSRGWHRVSIPVDRIPARLDRRLMAAIVLEQTVEGRSELRIRQMAFLRSDRSLDAEQVDTGLRRQLDVTRTATWVWNTSELLASHAKRDSLLDFVESQGVTTIFLQLPHDGSQSLPGEIVFDLTLMRSLLAETHRRGFEVYALDGYAYYGQSHFHDGVLATVKRVAEYNESVSPVERFVGIRYDIEPYLIPGFHGPAQESLFGGLLELMSKMKAVTTKSGLRLGADIPFWYDATSEYTGKPIEILWHGERKPPSEHIIDIADDIAIMDYRTSAYGADGTIRHATGELEYASANNTPVFIALETHPLPDEVLLDFSGTPAREFPDDPGSIAMIVFVKNDGRVEAHLLDFSGEALDAVRAEKVADARTSWEEADIYWWHVERSVNVPASKLSFSGLGINRLREVMSGTTQALSGFSAFAGIAIHHEGSYRELVNREAVEASLRTW